MRVVNGVERELLRSEWENWLADETYRCEQVGAMLLPRGGGGGKVVGGEAEEDGGEGASDEPGVMQKVLAGGGGGSGAEDGVKRREALRRWHAEYCGSCEADRRALLEKRREVASSSSLFV